VKSKYFEDEKTVLVNSIGLHMMKNSLAAISLATYLKIPAKIILDSLEKFNNTGSRLKLKKVSDYLIIDDSYNANPESVKAALITTIALEKNGRKIAILGDMLELGKDSKELHHEIGVFVSKLNFNRFIGVGNMMKYATDAAISCGMNKTNVVWYETSVEAQIESENFKKNDLILLKGSRGIKMERVIDNL
jgi:UDP-N-acetylmuramoyl-tripeptide--D-alanyl-D-alanine ligase